VATLFFFVDSDSPCKDQLFPQVPDLAQKPLYFVGTVLKWKKKSRETLSTPLLLLSPTEYLDMASMPNLISRRFRKLTDDFAAGYLGRFKNPFWEIKLGIGFCWEGGTAKTFRANTL